MRNSILVFVLLLLVLIIGLVACTTTDSESTSGWKEVSAHTYTHYENLLIKNANQCSGLKQIHITYYFDREETEPLSEAFIENKGEFCRMRFGEYPSDDIWSSVPMPMTVNITSIDRFKDYVNRFK